MQTCEWYRFEGSMEERVVIPGVGSRVRSHSDVVAAGKTAVVVDRKVVIHLFYCFIV
jgi:hypothetical protein